MMSSVAATPTEATTRLTSHTATSAPTPSLIPSLLKPYRADLTTVATTPTLTLSGPTTAVKSATSFTLRAVSSVAATAQQPITIIDASSGELLKSCSSGTSCSVTTSFTSLQQAGYVARHAQTESETYWVTPEVWQLTLSLDKQLVAVGETAKLNLLISQLPWNVRDVWGVRIVDTGTGAVARECDSVTSTSAGYRCTTSQAWTPEPSRTYRGELYDKASGDVLVYSNEATLASLPWVLSLDVDRQQLAPDGKALVTIHANQQINRVYSQFKIYLVTAPESQVVATCTSLVQNGSDFTCTAKAGAPPGENTEIFAVVASAADVASNQIAESNRVLLGVDPWSVRLETDHAVVEATEDYVVSAYVNGDLRDGSPRKRLYLLDADTGQTVSTCDVGQAMPSGERKCGTYLRGDPAITAHRYVAVIASLESPTVGVVATSNTVNVEPMPWTLVWSSLRPVGSVNDAAVPPGDPTGQVVLGSPPEGDVQAPPTQVILTGPAPGYTGSFRAASSQSLFATRGNYALYVKDVGSGEILNKCVGSPYEHAGTECGANISFDENIQPRRVEAFIAPADDPSGPRLASTPIQHVVRARVEAALGPASKWCSGENGGISLVGESNYNVNYSSYRPKLYGPGAGGWGSFYMYTGYKFFASYRSCQNIPEGGYYYRLEGFSNGMTDVIATSNVVFYPGGIGAQEQMAGGNAAENCVQSCAGDPVNTVTGEFFENNEDLRLEGAGPALSWTRSYSSTARESDNGLGYGWTSGAGMHVEVPEGSSIAGATYARVVQENGAYVVFARNALGEWVAPSQVFATLEDQPDGGVRFIRRQKEQFDFSPDGDVTRVSDLNGNAITFHYLGDNLARMQSDDGRWIEVRRDQAGRIEGIADSAGRSVTYEYSAVGDLIAVEGSGGNRTSYDYDSSHRVTSLTPPATGTTWNVYDSQSRVIRQTAPDGGVTQFAYGASSTLITHPDGSQVLEQYDKSRLVARTTAYGTPIAATTQFTYTTRYQAASMVDPSGRVTHFVYDVEGNLRQVVNSRNEATTYDYDARSNLVRVRNSLGSAAEFEYDERDNVIAATDPLGNRFTYTVDAFGRRTATTDPLGHTGTVAYDSYSTPVTSISPGGVVTAIEADQLGRTVKSWDPRAWLPGAEPSNFATSYSYTPLGLLDTVTGADGSYVSFEYDTGGRMISTTDALGRTSEITYDSMGRPVSEIDPSGQITTYEYDRMSRVVKETRAGVAAWSYAYDALGRVVALTDPEGGTTWFTYNASDQHTSVTDPDGRTTTLQYDASGRLASQTGPDGGVTTYINDALGRVTQVVDPAGRATTYTYDAAGRLIATEFPDASVSTASYDALGRVLTTTDTQGRMSTYSYDPDGRQTRAVDVLGRETTASFNAGYLTQQTGADGAIFSYEYDARGYMVGTRVDGSSLQSSVIDAAGRVVSATEPAGVTTYTYDALDRVIEVQGPTGDVGYEYDALGLVTTITYPSGTTVNRQHDLLGRLTEVSSSVVGLVSYEWSPGGVLDATSFPNGVDTTFTHDMAGRLTGVDMHSDAEPMLSLDYAYDQSGRLTGRTTTRPTRGALTETFVTDPLGRVAPLGPSGPAATFSRSHEPLTFPDGRVLALSAAGIPETLTVEGTAIQFEHDVAGQRLNESINGNLTKNYEWNAQGLLTGVADSLTGLDLSFEYSSGLRVNATGTTGSTQVDADYVWDTVHAVPLLLDDGRYEYVYGAGTAPIAQVDTATGDVEFLHGDLVGSTREVTDDAGNIVARFDYGMYGDVRAVSGATSTTSFLFAGEYRDPSGTYYLRNRVFDPNSGTFLSADPILSVTGMPYAYTSGNPFQGTDPLGLYGLGDFWDDVTDTAGAVWEEVSSPEFLVSTAVFIGCTAVFGPGGVVGCSAGAGAVYSAIDYTQNTPADCQSLGGYFTSVATGTAYGLAGGAIAGPVARPVFTAIGKAIQPLRPAVTSALTPLRNAIQKLTPQTRTAANSANLETRVAEVHGALDPIAQTSRTTAALGTREGTTVIGGGVRDLSPAQRALVREGEMMAGGPGHAEVTTVLGARGAGLTPQEIVTSWDICPACQTFLRNEGATLTGPRSARW